MNIKKLSKPGQVRHGDVLLVPIPAISAAMKPIKSRTLALGEATGHHHTFDSGATCYADDENAPLAEVVRIEREATITHQEHESIQLPAGDYIKGYQMEEIGDETQMVKD